ncbi:MAG: LysM peptidoglycan-binding domain-containing protein [Planctomycetota bacterium]
MNSSYKIALLAAFAVLAIVIGYYAFFSSDPSQANEGPEPNLADNTSPGSTDNKPTPPGPRNPAPRPAPQPSPEPQPQPGPDSETSPGREITIGPEPGETTGPVIEPEGGADQPIDPETPLAPAPVVEPSPEPTLIDPAVEIDPAIGPAAPGPESEDPAPGPETAVAPRARTYTVQPGDTLSGIAQEVYDDETAWIDIAQANGSIDPTRLQPGQVLILPDIDIADQPDPEPLPVAPGLEQTYEIQPGDNLSRIAQRFYSDPDAWQVIYNRNRDRIGDSPNRLKVGMTIIIPPRYDGAN